MFTSVIEKNFLFKTRLKNKIFPKAPLLASYQNNSYFEKIFSEGNVM